MPSPLSLETALKQKKFALGGAAAALEREGQWRSLLMLVGAWMHDGSWRELPPRWQAGAARALVFSGRAREATEILASLRARAGGQRAAEPDPETLAVALLAEAALSRQDRRWDANERLAAEALKIALAHGLLHAEADARFALALSWGEAGRWARALDAFQAMRLDPRPLSEYRRGLAAMNEAWALWDSGQPELLAEIVPAMPAAYRPKALTYAAAWDDRVTWLRERVANGFADEIAAADEIQIAMILCEWQSLAGEDAIVDVEGTWLWRRLRELRERAPERALRKLEACEALLAGRGVKWPEEALREETMLYVELANLSALSSARRSPAEARAAYRERLLPALKEFRMRSPLLPTWQELRAPTSGWARRLAASFGMGDAIASGAAPIAKLTLSGAALRGPTGAEISFAKSPASRALLGGLAGRAGQAFRKEDLHVRMTGAAYRADLHDARLHKLLKRLSERIESALGVRPWTMPGNNTVELAADLEAR